MSFFGPRHTGIAEGYDYSATDVLWIGIPLLLILAFLLWLLRGVR